MLAAMSPRPAVAHIAIGSRFMKLPPAAGLGIVVRCSCARICFGDGGAARCMNAGIGTGTGTGGAVEEGESWECEEAGWWCSSSIDEAEGGGTDEWWWACS